MSPSLDRRLKALGVMGATVAPRAGRGPSALMWCALAPVIALLVVLMGAVVFGLLYVSVALSGLFTWLPVALIVIAEFGVEFYNSALTHKTMPVA